MPIYSIKAPNGKIYDVNAPEGASQEDLFGFVQQQLDEENLRRLQKETTGVFETGKRAVARGFGQLGSTFTDVIPAIGGSLLGFNEFAKEQLQEAEEKRAAREAKYPTLFRSYKEVEGALDAPKFAIETIGEQAANIASVIGTVLATRGLGLPMAATALGISRPAIASQAAARGLTGEAAEQFVAQRLAATAPEMAKLATRADIGSAFLGSYALNAPEIFENIYENNDKQLAPGASLIWGVGAAALDSILPYKLSRQLTGPMKAGIVEKVLEKSGMDKGILRSVTAGALSSIGTEGLTEGAQEAISIAAERFVSENPKIFGSKEWDRIMESGIRGAVAGGAFGGVGGGVGGLRTKEEVAEEKTAFEDAQKKLKSTLEEEGVVPKEVGDVTQPVAGAEAALPAAPTAPTAPTEAPTAPTAPTEAPTFLGSGESQEAVQARIDAQKQQALAEIEATKQRFAEAQAKTQAEAQAKEQAKAEAEAQRPAPVTLESISKIDDPVAFGKLLGIGRTARVLRADGPLAGADLSNPDDVKRVKAALEGYASGKPAPGAAEKIEKLFQRPEFQEVSTDVTRLDEQPSGAGTEVPSGGVAAPSAVSTEQPQPGGVVPSGGDAGRVVGGEGPQQSTLIPKPGEAPAQPPAPPAEPIVEPPAAPQSTSQLPNIKDIPGIQVGTTYIRPTPIAEGKPLFRETNAQGLDELLQRDDQPTYQPIYVSENPDTALGQGKNRGVYVTFRPDSLSGAVHKKPGTEFAGLEHVVDIVAPKAIHSIVIPKTELQKLKLSWLAKVNLRKNFNQTSLPDGSIRFDRKGIEPATQVLGPVEAPAPAPKPAAPREKGKKLSLPKYEGPKFDDTQRKLAESGDVNGLLRNLLDSIKDPEIKQVLRRIRSLNLKTKIKIAPIGQSGIYNNALTDTDPDTIFLDPEQGMNAHTFIHEAVHAAISNVLSNPNHPLTKQFQKFFISVQDRLGAAYGATDLQEFAAELTSNPSFQAVLKTIKAPKSENMFVRILQSIAEFFGFPPKTTAFEKGIKFLNDAIDITNDVPATAAERLFLGDATNQSQAVNEVQEAQPSLVGKKIEETRNFLSNLSGSDVQRLAFGLMRLDNIYDLYKKELPSVKRLLDAVERRAGQEERDIAHASENFKKFLKVQKKFPAAMRALNELAIKASDAQVNLLSDKFEYRLVDMADWEKMTQKQRNNYQMVEAQRKRDYNALKPEFDVLPDQVKEVYRAIRDDFDKAFQRYRKILEDAAQGSPALLAKLREEFMLKQPLIGYIPFRRYGDFWLEFVDPNTDAPVAMSFESIRERQKFIDEQLKDIPEDPRRPRYVAYNKFNDIKFDASNIPPTHFLNDVVKKLRDEGASDTQIDSVYQAYLAAFPAESIAKQFMKRTGKRGMEADIVRGYNDLMVRWARKLANSEYLPKIDQALEQIKQEGQAHQRATGGDPAVGAAVQNILNQRAFLHNPTYNSLVSGTAQLSFFEFMAGNISSAVINLTSLPLMVYPLLTGKFGWGDVVPAMTSAMREATNNWGDMGKYKNLYKTLDDHGQLKHTMAREVLEGRRQKSEDYTGIKARIMDGLAYPFSVSERWNRAATAIAAFNLAVKQGMNEQQAIDYALETVKTAHTSGMAVTGPRWMQTPLGRMFFTFKSIVWQQAYVLGRAFYQAFKGETKEIRNAAQRQLLATYGMATVFVGVKGMPFYGAVSVLAEMLASMFGDDDEPFDFNEFMRSVFGEFLYKGAFNYFTNLEVANRAGLATDLVFRDDPRGVAEHGYVFSALQQMFGPVGSIAVNSERAVKMFKDGYYERSLETVAPSFFRNAMKGVRYMNEGAVTLKGDPIDEDIGAYNSVMQVVGFAPADLSNKYEMLQMAKGFERAVELRRRDALRMYDIAYRSGDTELMDEARERIQSFNQKHPKYRITQDSLTRSRKAREAAEREMIYGVRFNKNLRGEIKERFFEEE